MLTTVLEVGGSLLLIGALALVVAPFSVPGALAVAGAGLIGLSLVLERLVRK